MARMTTADKDRLRARSAKQNILWAALAKLAESEYNRDDLVAGQHEVAILIEAEVDGTPLSESAETSVAIQGGGVYHPSIKAPADHLLAILWSKLPETIRLQLAADLPPYYEEHKELPAVDEVHMVAIASLTKRLTARGPAKPKAGSITTTRH